MIDGDYDEEECIRTGVKINETWILCRTQMLVSFPTSQYHSD